MEPKNTTNKYLGLALFWTAGITVACLISFADLPEVDIQVEDTDKIVHFSFYTVFAILWFLSLKSVVATSNKLFLYVFLFSVLFGIVIEICQSLFTETRQADVMDVLANTLGSLFGLVLVALYSRFKK